ncbi:SDR family oxidoreductase [Georgenia sp. Z1344]|uniref:SDR family oxidoreductase n=1 Tax=Georgenia sp. Z1344 TaxID=3416706 RepID=UPI003CF69DE5
MTANVIVLGGHGKVALLLHPLLVERGDSVDAVIRNPEHADEIRAAGANPVVADIEHLSTEELTDLISGHDAVVFSAGAGGGNPQRTYAVDRDAAIRSMDAAKAAGVSRYVMVSYVGAGPDHGVPEDSSFFPYAESKSAADEHLRASGLDWTILGPGGLTLEEPSGRITVTDTSGETSRANVAAVAAAALETPSAIGRTINFHDGDTPIADALA